MAFDTMHFDASICIPCKSIVCVLVVCCVCTVPEYMYGYDIYAGGLTELMVVV